MHQLSGFSLIPLHLSLIQLQNPATLTVLFDLIHSIASVDYATLINKPGIWRLNSTIRPFSRLDLLSRPLPSFCPPALQPMSRIVLSARTSVGLTKPIHLPCRVDPSRSSFIKDYHNCKHMVQQSKQLRHLLVNGFGILARFILAGRLFRHSSCERWLPFIPDLLKRSFISRL